jgi:hypothetical protein
MTFNPGSPTVFDILKVSSSDGMFAPYSAVNAGGQIYFCSTQGFKTIAPGGAPVPIGKEKFDRSFFADVDQANPQLIIGAPDPKGPRIYWAYKSLAGQAGLFDKIIIYDWMLQRATLILMSGEYLATLAKPGLTLENLDAVAPGGSLDALAFSLDTISTGALAQLCGVSGAHALGFYSGSNLAATLQTAEQGDSVRRMRVQGLRPVTDAAGARAAVVYRETLQAAPSVSAGSAVDALGHCPQNVSTRYARGQLTIPYAASWSFAAGIEPQFVAEGSQ